MANSIYIKSFGYIGANIGEREKLIEVGEPDEYDEKGNLTVECQARKFEQSDMVIILLNLAYIPDSVVYEFCEIHGFKPGWSKVFLEVMNRYKETWENEHPGKKWQW